MSIFIKLGWYFRREWKLYSAGVLGLVLTAIIGIIPPRIIGDVVDGINQHHLTARSLMIYRNHWGSCHWPILSALSLAQCHLGWCGRPGTDAAGTALLAFYEDGRDLLSEVSHRGSNGACD